MKAEYLEIVDSLMTAIDQTEASVKAERKNPWLNGNMEKIEALIAGLPDQEEIQEAVYDLANAYTYHYTLFGIQVAQAIQAVSRDPGKLAKHIMERTGRA